MEPSRSEDYYTIEEILDVSGRTPFLGMDVSRGTLDETVKIMLQNSMDEMTKEQ